MEEYQIDIFDLLEEKSIKYDNQIYVKAEDKIIKHFTKARYMNLDNKQGVQILEKTKNDGDINVNGEHYRHVFINPYKYF